MKEGSMIQWIGVTVAIVCFLGAPKMAGAQNLPILNMGFSGGGAGADLLQRLSRPNPSRQPGVAVRPVCLTRGASMARAPSARALGIAAVGAAGLRELG